MSFRQAPAEAPEPASARRVSVGSPGTSENSSLEGSRALRPGGWWPRHLSSGSSPSAGTSSVASGRNPAQRQISNETIRRYNSPV